MVKIIMNILYTKKSKKKNNIKLIEIINKKQKTLYDIEKF